MKLLTLTAFLSALLLAGAARAGTPALLPSWNDSPAKQAIVDFVSRAVKPGGDDFIPPAERIAVFDNDGTLWSEQPMYTQMFFTLDRIRALAPLHPEWREQEPFASVLRGDIAGALAGGVKSAFALVLAAHAGMTEDEFARIARDWFVTARHPETGRLFTDMAYQPMLEVMDYLRDNSFSVHIVSGGGGDLIRAFAEKTYGVPPENIIGSSLKTEWSDTAGEAQVFRTAEIDAINDGPAKPLAIQRDIGRRPVMAFGNSDGDLQMLQLTASGPRPGLAILIHHTDGEREWAYDRQSRTGRLDKALDEAMAKGWVVVDIAKDWNAVFGAGSN